MEQQETVEYIKTIREIADEIGVSKQAVFKKINRQPLSTELMGLTATIGGRLMVSVDGERLIKRAFCVDAADLARQPSTQTVNCQPSIVNQVDGTVDSLTTENVPESLDESAQNEDDGAKNEIVFLRQQIETMNNQMLRRDAMIESLNKELEKEREHNREKDRQLLDTLSKLAETQVALAVGQSAEKQKELAETLIEGQQKMDEVQPDSVDIRYGEFEEESQDEPKKRGWLRRVWRAITGRNL